MKFNFLLHLLGACGIIWIKISSEN